MEETRRPSIRVTTYRQRTSAEESSTGSLTDNYPRDNTSIDDAKPMMLVQDLVGNSVTTLTGSSRSGSAVVVSNKQQPGIDNTRCENNEGGGSLSQKPSLGKEPTTFCENQQVVVHRTGWDLYGMVEDKEDSPMRKFAGDKVATAIIKLDDCLINPMEFGGYSHSFWLAPPPGVINETNDGRELKWIILASNEEIKFEWIGALIKGAGWRERHIAETGQVPKITVHHPIEESLSVRLDSPSADSIAESPILSPLQLSSASSSCGNMDTLFPFPTPDLTTLKDTAFSSHATFPESPSQNSRRSSLHSQEALALISASNARFFKNGGYKTTSSSVSRRSSGSASISSKSMDGARSFTEADIRISKSSSGSSSSSSGSSGLSSRRASGGGTNGQGSQPLISNSQSSSPSSAAVLDKLPRRQTSPNLPRASVRDRMVLERTTSTVSNPGDTCLQRRKTAHVAIRETADDADERSNVG
ncbi:hypothetical protein HDU81_009549 [Chytriomyces hyalinus]|nr:hypothetical protein HDU81_009549 [Chytriomyces hyalinus]